MILILIGLYYCSGFQDSSSSHYCGICGYGEGTKTKTFYFFSYPVFKYNKSYSDNRIEKTFDENLRYKHKHIWAYETTGTSSSDLLYHTYEHGHGKRGLNGYSDQSLEVVRFSLGEIQNKEYKDLPIEEKRKAYEAMLNAKDTMDWFDNKMERETGVDPRLERKNWLEKNKKEDDRLLAEFTNIKIGMTYQEVSQHMFRTPICKGNALWTYKLTSASDSQEGNDWLLLIFFLNGKVSETRKTHR